MFVDMTEREREELFETPGKIRTWTLSAVRTRDGMPVGRREGLTDLPQAPMAMAHSRIYVPTRRDNLASMVLFDRDVIEGLPVFQLADYVTMRALGGETFRELASGGGTILSLDEDPQSAPKELTLGDRTYLETLYGSMANLPAALTLATVQRRIEELRE